MRWLASGLKWGFPWLSRDPTIGGIKTRIVRPDRRMTPKLKLPTREPGHPRSACEPWGQLDRPQAELSSDRCDLVLARRSRRHREAIAQPAAGIEPNTSGPMNFVNCTLIRVFGRCERIARVVGPAEHARPGPEGRSFLPRRMTSKPLNSCIRFALVRYPR
jgi:hypothetical protein